MASQLLTAVLIMSTTKSDLVSIDQLDTVRGGFSDATKKGAIGTAIAGGLGGAWGGSILRSLNNNRGYGAGKGAVVGIVGGLILGGLGGAFVNAAEH